MIHHDGQEEYSEEAGKGCLYWCWRHQNRTNRLKKSIKLRNDRSTLNFDQQKLIVSWGCLRHIVYVDGLDGNVRRMMVRSLQSASNHSNSLNMIDMCTFFVRCLPFSPFLESIFVQQPPLSWWFEMVQVGRFRLYLEQLFSLCPVELWCQTCWRHVIFTSNHFLDGMHIEMINLPNIMFCCFLQV